MSSGLNCEFIKLGNGEVFYLLQNWDCPAGASNWHEYATASGPFASMEQADEHLSDNHQNPGAAAQYDYVAGSDAAIDRLIAEARMAKPPKRSWGW